MKPSIDREKEKKNGWTMKGEMLFQRWGGVETMNRQSMSQCSTSGSNHAGGRLVSREPSQCWASTTSTESNSLHLQVMLTSLLISFKTPDFAYLNVLYTSGWSRLPSKNERAVAASRVSQAMR